MTDERLDRLEQAVSLLLSEAGHVTIGDYQSLRREVRHNAVDLANEAMTRMRETVDAETERVQWTGSNFSTVTEFVGGDATLDFKDQILYCTQRGNTFSFTPGSWLGRNRYTGWIYEAGPPIETRIA